MFVFYFCVASRSLVSTVFRFMDVNGDNVLEFGEIKEMFKVLNFAITSRELDAMIKQVDSDGDAAVSEEEFLHIIGMAKLGLLGEGLGKIMFDNLRAILDLARHAEAQCQTGQVAEGDIAVSSPLHALRNSLTTIKLAQSKSFLQTRQAKLQSESMLLDWRSEEEKHKAMRIARDKSRTKNKTVQMPPSFSSPALSTAPQAREDESRHLCHIFVTSLILDIFDPDIFDPDIFNPDIFLLGADG